MKPLSVLALAGYISIAPGLFASSGTETYCGICDASAVTVLDEDRFIVGDDEDNVLRVFSRAEGGMAVERFSLASFLGLGHNDEADIEGSTRIGDTIFWITSHGNNRKGKGQESRHRFFAVTVQTNRSRLQINPVGVAYKRLLDDVLAHPALKRFDLGSSLNLPPKTPGALNIEGLAATPRNELLIGFRNPVPQGKAMILTLRNPVGVLHGERAQLDGPQLLDLAGYGVRSIERSADGYLIIAGSVDGGGSSRLYFWDGAKEPLLLRGVDFAGINPEAIAITERDARRELFVVSDDGTRKIDGIECKKLKDPALRTFRARSVPLALPLAATPR